MTQLENGTLTAAELLAQLEALRETVSRGAEGMVSRWREHLHREEFLPSAHNFASYLILRHHDLRSLQTQLTPWGLSSIGRCESHVLPALDSVIDTLQSLVHLSPRRVAPSPRQFFEGDELLEQATERLLGPATDGRRVRIMVTLPSEAAHDYSLVRDLVAGGMNVARINCAHDDEDKWFEMVRNILKANAETGRSCRISMDLAGPKIRTEALGFKRKHVFNKGDRVLLVPGEPGESKRFPYQVSCSLKEVFEHARSGHSVWIDDGAIGARVEEVLPEGLLLRLEHVRVKGESIREEKGLNFPDTPLSIPALTDKDLQDLDFVSQHAHIVNFSFVQTADDVVQLQQELASRIADPERLGQLGIVAKIETKKALSNLPEIMVRISGRNPAGVMIARGDLAVEIGFQRLAEIQEEVLWLCEAAHMPVIWATQVMENFVKQGIPTRAEVTDAAMAERAECVMLNKGDFIREALPLLTDVLTRMEGHQFKKRSELRALKAWPLDIEALLSGSTSGTADGG